MRCKPGLGRRGKSFGIHFELPRPESPALLSVAAADIELQQGNEYWENKISVSWPLEGGAAVQPWRPSRL